MPRTTKPSPRAAATAGRLLVLARATTRSWPALAVRLMGGLIFLGTGTAKEVSGSFHANWAAMVGQLHLPLSQVAVAVTPVLEILTGVLLLLGLFARAAGAAGLLLMAGAAWVHLTVDPGTLPEGMPPVWLPVVTALASGFVLWRGAGSGSLDLRSLHRRRAGA